MLRFARLEGVAPNDFYDAAVRSMSMSWHNFLFGAFDPRALLSIDKPPLDLWLQVVSVKLLGFGRIALQLPAAIAGTLAVPALYFAVRGACGRPAALGSALALAVTPASVLTARSDTMDALMMLLVTGALWLTVRACADGRGRREIVLAGIALGVAFNVKLLEGMLCLPALATMYLLGGAAPVRRKLADLLLGAAALLVLGLAWVLPASLWPGRHPWPVGSASGSLWDALFVFNGVSRVSGTPDRRPGGPGPFRLEVSTGWHYDRLFGCVLVAALAIGGVAVVTAWRRREPGSGLAGAFAAALAVWILAGLAVFDTIGTVHARYLDALAPAVAAAIGCGAAWLAGLGGGGRSRRPPVPAALAALACVSAYTFHFGIPAAEWGAVALLVAALGAGLATSASGRLGAGSRWALCGLALAVGLAYPVRETLALIRARDNDSLGLAVAPRREIAALSRFLIPRDRGTRYELAVDEPLQLAPLIIRDGRAILPLTSWGGRPLTGLAALQADVRSGAVRYGLVGAYRCGPANPRAAACGPAAEWIRRSGIDVSREAGLRGRSRLYLLQAPSRSVSSGGSG